MVAIECYCPTASGLARVSGRTSDPAAKGQTPFQLASVHTYGLWIRFEERSEPLDPRFSVL
jgi:hypothetical protein